MGGGGMSKLENFQILIMETSIIIFWTYIIFELFIEI